MSKEKFKREDRYYVFKTKDVEKYLVEADRLKLNIILEKLEHARLSDDKQNLECVVVEHDWPMYEKTWKDIEKFSKSRKAKPFVKTQKTLNREYLDSLEEANLNEEE